MSTPQTFAAAPIRMVDVPHPDGRFPRVRSLLDLLLGSGCGDDWRLQSRRNRWALYAGRAAEDFDAVGDDRSAAACRNLALGAKQ